MIDWLEVEERVRREDEMATAGDFRFTEEALDDERQGLRRQFATALINLGLKIDPQAADEISEGDA